MPFKTIVFCLLFLVEHTIFAQDTLYYFQEDQFLFSNIYQLYPNSQTFEHWFRTDDFQTWYGRGSYTVKNKKLTFKFDASIDTCNKCLGEIHYEEGIKRSVKLYPDYFISKDYYYTSTSEDIKFIRYQKGHKNAYWEKYHKPHLEPITDSLLVWKLMSKIKIKTIFEDESGAVYTKASFPKKLKDLDGKMVKVKGYLTNFYGDILFARIICTFGCSHNCASTDYISIGPKPIFKIPEEPELITIQGRLRLNYDDPLYPIVSLENPQVLP